MSKTIGVLVSDDGYEVVMTTLSTSVQGKSDTGNLMTSNGEDWYYIKSSQEFKSTETHKHPYVEVLSRNEDGKKLLQEIADSGQNFTVLVGVLDYLQTEAYKMSTPPSAIWKKRFDKLIEVSGKMFGANLSRVELRELNVPVSPDGTVFKDVKNYDSISDLAQYTYAGVVYVAGSKRSFELLQDSEAFKNILEKEGLVGRPGIETFTKVGIGLVLTCFCDAVARLVTDRMDPEYYSLYIKKFSESDISETMAAEENLGKSRDIVLKNMVVNHMTEKFYNEYLIGL